MRVVLAVFVLFLLSSPSGFAKSLKGASTLYAELDDAFEVDESALDPTPKAQSQSSAPVDKSVEETAPVEDKAAETVTEGEPAAIAKEESFINSQPQQKKFIESEPSEDVFVTKQPRSDGENNDEKASKFTVTAMIGIMNTTGAWGSSVRNRISVGGSIDYSLSSTMSLEVEGMYDAKRMNLYSNYKNCNLWSAGANIKFSPRVGPIRLMFGAGAVGLFYSQLQSASYPKSQKSLGAAQVMTGAEWMIGKSVGIGVRGAYVMPIVNNQSGGQSFVYPEDRITGSPYYRLMGTLSVGF